jgi:hypothetical protein
MSTQKDTEYPEEEAARRRDEVIRRMANTPPQPKSKKPASEGTKIRTAKPKGRSQAE